MLLNNCCQKKTIDEQGGKNLVLIPEVKEEHRATKNNEGDGHRCHNDRTSNTTSSATTFDVNCQYKYITNIHSCLASL